MMSVHQNPANSPETVAIRLPELTAEIEYLSKSPRSVDWVNSLLSCSTGHLTVDLFSDMGVILQVVSVDTARCILVVDESLALKTLKALSISFEAAGKNLEIDPFAVLMEYRQPTENDVSSVVDATDVTISSQNDTRHSDYNFAMEVA